MPDERRRRNVVEDQSVGGVAAPKRPAPDLRNELTKRIEVLRREEQQLLAHLNAHAGRIWECEFWLAKLSEAHDA